MSKNQKKTNDSITLSYFWGNDLVKFNPGKLTSERFFIAIQFSKGLNVLLSLLLVWHRNWLLIGI